MITAIIEHMATLHMTEDELVKDIAAVLAKVREGAEVVVEQGYHPIAVIRPAKRFGRPIPECIASAKAYEEKLGYRPIPDPGFAKDVQAGIDARLEPLNPPAWD